MEVYSSSVEDQLIDGLSFKLSAGSSYITDRKSVTFFPSGSNVYTSTSGTRILRFLINGDDWIDSTNTLRIFFDIANTGTQPLRVLGGPYSFFRRMRVLCGNQLVEDIDYYNRNHYLFDIMRARHVRENEDGEGVGDDRFDAPKYQPVFESSESTTNNPVYPYGPLSRFNSDYISVPPGKSKTVSFKPLSGLLSCGKLLPLRYAPMIELELISNATDPVISVDDAALIINTSGVTGINSGAPNNSISWTIQNPQIKADICVLDNALNNEYAALLLSGKSLPINYSSFVCQLQSISGQTPSVNITRALSRLKSVFVTLDQTNGYTSYTGNNLHTPVWKKNWNDFFHPMTFGGGSYNPEYEITSIQMQLGSKMFPEYPMASAQECFYQLRKTMGVENSNFHSLDITPFEFTNHKFVIAFDCEKNLGSAFTGINTKAGSLLTVKLKSSVPSANMPDTMFVTLHYDSILQIGDSGIQVFE